MYAYSGVYVDLWDIWEYQLTPRCHSVPGPPPCCLGTRTVSWEHAICPIVHSNTYHLCPIIVKSLAHSHIREPMLGPASNVLIWWNAFPRYWIFLQPKARETWARHPPSPGGGAFLAFLTYSLIIPLVTGERDETLRDVVPLVTLYSGAKGQNWSESVLNNCVNGTGPLRVVDGCSAGQ